MRGGWPTGAGLRISVYAAGIDAETDPENPHLARGEAVVVDMSVPPKQEPTDDERAVGFQPRSSHKLSA